MNIPLKEAPLAATASGAMVIFKQGKDALIHKEGTRFNIHVYNRLYYLHPEGEISASAALVMTYRRGMRY